jgi:hypothetical protein
MDDDDDMMMMLMMMLYCYEELNLRIFENLKISSPQFGPQITCCFVPSTTAGILFR